MTTVESRYTDGTYFEANPDWDRQHSHWKASMVLAMLTKHRVIPASVCEVGCGAGDILVHLEKELPGVTMRGFDISPQAVRFWDAHRLAGTKVEFCLADFHAVHQQAFDVLLMCDVFEHVRDPLTFLRGVKTHARHFVFHIPLDLSASSVARGTPLLAVRDKVGHLHSYTKDLALATLRDAGYDIVDWSYTGAWSNAPCRSLQTRALAGVRRLVFAFNKDFGVRLLGGETLLVLAT